MKKEPLDDLLNTLRQEEIPPCPPNLEANVLRTVRLRQADLAPRNLLFGELFRSLLRPGYAAAALAIAVASSAATTAVATDISARSPARPALSAQPADVFELQLLSHSEDVLACCRPPAKNSR